MYAATVRSLDDSEDLARCDAGSALELAGAARFIAAGGAKRPLREQGGRTEVNLGSPKLEQK